MDTNKITSEITSDITSEITSDITFLKYQNEVLKKTLSKYKNENIELKQKIILLASQIAENRSKQIYIN
jgi:hypothetical protein